MTTWSREIRDAITLANRVRSFLDHYSETYAATGERRRFVEACTTMNMLHDKLIEIANAEGTT